MEAIDLSAAVTLLVETGRVRVAELARWWLRQDRLRHTLPRALLALVLVGYFVVFERLVWARHVHFNTADYDLGLNSQAAWLLAHGESFMTIRGMEVFGHHANVGYLLFAPAYWFGAGSQFLDVVNTLAITAGAVPLFLLGRYHMKSDWFGLGLAVAYLFHFLPQWLIWETFHPENLAIPALFFAFWFATIGRWRLFAVSVVFAMLWKEDVALIVMMLGIFVFFFFKNRRVGLLTFAGGLTWFLLVTKLIEPYFSPAGAVYDTYFGTLGSSGNELVANSVRDPGLVLRTLGTNDAEGGALALIRGYGFVPFGGAVVFMLGLPQHVINFLSVEAFTRDPRTHYFAMPFVAVTLAATWVLGNRHRSSVAWVLLCTMLIGVAATQGQGIGPWTDNAKQGYWPQQTIEGEADLYAAMALVPDDAGVSASTFLVPHLSERAHVYTFPNPWVSSYYGPGGTNLKGDEAAVDYLVVNTNWLNDADRAVFERVRGSGRFDTIWQQGTVVVLRRR